MKHVTRKGGAALLLVLATLWWAPNARAQQALLWELSPGEGEAEETDYVVLRLEDVPSLDGWSVRGQLADGTEGPQFASLSGAPPASTGFVVIGTAAMERFYGVSPDVLVSGATLPEGSGRVCLLLDEVEVDCVAYGQYTGENATFGAPAAGLQLGRALTRVAVSGNNVTDWVLAFPAPGQYLEPEPSDRDGGAGLPDAGLADGGPDGGLADGGFGDGGVDGGPADAGPPPVARGLPPLGLGVDSGEIPDQSVGCACSATGSAGPLALLAMIAVGLALVRRRRSRSS